MGISSFLLNFSLLRVNAAFRAIFIARLFSVFALGMLIVGVPIQIQALTGSTFQVAIVSVIDGIGLFIGLILGGIIADRYDRRQVILLARLTCGIGFILLTLNSLWSNPSLIALYLLSVWDGFFGALGLTALMAAIPQLVGRENLAIAGGLNMITVRLGAVISPSLGGIFIGIGGVTLNFAIAALATLITLIPLSKLPAMPIKEASEETSLQALSHGIKFSLAHPLLGLILWFSLLTSMASAIRVLFPVLTIDIYKLAPMATGFLYSAVPLGALLGALTSGWITMVAYPGRVMLILVVLIYGYLLLLAQIQTYSFALFLFMGYGYLTALLALLQYILVQNHTPNQLLGRINSLVTIQEITGDSVAALGLGFYAQRVGVLNTLAVFASSMMMLCLLSLGVAKRLWTLTKEKSHFE